MFKAWTFRNYTVAVEVGGRYLFAFDVREWPAELPIPDSKAW